MTALVSRSVVLDTGMSGTGKSTALAQLGRRGHRVVDTDDPGWIVHVATPHGIEPTWDLDGVGARLDGHHAGWLFVPGCVANQGALYHRFDVVVLLSAPVGGYETQTTTTASPWPRRRPLSSSPVTTICSPLTSRHQRSLRGLCSNDWGDHEQRRHRPFMDPAPGASAARPVTLLGGLEGRGPLQGSASAPDTADLGRSG